MVALQKQEHERFEPIQVSTTAFPAVRAPSVSFTVHFPVLHPYKPWSQAELPVRAQLHAIALGISQFEPSVCGNTSSVCLHNSACRGVDSIAWCTRAVGRDNRHGNRHMNGPSASCTMHGPSSKLHKACARRQPLVGTCACYRARVVDWEVHAECRVCEGSVVACF